MFDENVNHEVKKDRAAYWEFSACAPPQFVGSQNPLIWWEVKLKEKGIRWLEACSYKQFKEMVNVEYAPVKEIGKTKEEFHSLVQTHDSQGRALDSHDIIEGSFKINRQTSRHISLGLVFNQASSTITPQIPSEHELDILFETMFDGYMGEQPKDATIVRTTPLPQTLITPNTSTTIELQAPTTTNSSIDPSNIANTSQTVDEESIEYSCHSLDPSSMHTFYQQYPSEHRWTKDHPLEQVLSDTSKPVMTRYKLATDPEMYKGLKTKQKRYEVPFIRGSRYEVAGNVRWQYEVAAAGQSEHNTCHSACVSTR
ncbi:hypothetical protein Tco_0792219 [Tanacetum coccineum]